MGEVSTLHYGAFRLEIDTEAPADWLARIAEKVDDDREPMTLFARLLGDQVRANIDSGPGPALTPESVERKRRSGQPATPLHGTGAMRANLRERSRKHYAAVKRGPGDQFAYEFMQEMGIGRLEARPHMSVHESMEGQLETILTDWWNGLVEAESSV